MPARNVPANEPGPRPRQVSPSFDSAGDLFRVEWSAVPGRDVAPRGHIALVGPDTYALASALRESGDVVAKYCDLEEMLCTVHAGVLAPAVVLASSPATGRNPIVNPAADAHAAAAWALDTVQAWMSEDSLSDAMLVIVTHQAIACRPGETVTGFPDAAIWGLARSAQSEYPGRIILLDLDGSSASPAAITEALASGEPQIAIRDGTVRAARLIPVRSGLSSALKAPDASAWRLGVEDPASLDNLALCPAPGAMRPLGPQEVRVAVRACGLNFRDVLLALGTYPGQALLGGEVAGVIAEAGPDVTSFKPGDRVTGLAEGAMGPVAVTSHRLLVHVPEGWSFTEAATMPVAFLTAHYGLTHLARVQRGDRVLIHAAAGGVGMAATQIASRLGAEVFATASPDKWPVLTAAGIAEDHIASSREPGFDSAFLWATGGTGVDVVLNSLTGEFIDASLRLLRAGGRFIELGKRDMRSVGLAARLPDVSCHTLDLLELPPGQIATLLAELCPLFESGELSPLPVRAWDIRHAREAFRFMRDGRHTGKIALTVPARHDPEGTFLITGGTGVLGRRLARHLAATYGVRRMLLVSRKGGRAPGACELADDLARLGAEVTFASCDLTDFEALRSVVAVIPAEHPLTCVVHAAA
ncbi:MAG: SpnB-like Rossmann fold domain-containing protein, partial [Trebonia sp.]